VVTAAARSTSCRTPSCATRPPRSVRCANSWPHTPTLEAVLVGDGWPVFRDGRARLRELCDRVTTTI
jgi:hypothetical protein